MGVEFVPLKVGTILTSLRYIVIFAILMLALLYFVYAHRRVLVDILYLRENWSPKTFPVLLLLIIFGIFTFNTNVVNFHSFRYLLPLYSVLPVLIACLLIGLVRHHRWIVVALFCVLMSHYGYENYLLLKNTKPNYQFDELIAHLMSKQIQGGFADYWISYKVTYLSNEELIIAPYKSVNRYPPYVTYAQQLKRPVYIFYPNDPKRVEFEKEMSSRKQRYYKEHISGFDVYHFISEPGFNH